MPCPADTGSLATNQRIVGSTPTQGAKLKIFDLIRLINCRIIYSEIEEINKGKIKNEKVGYTFIH